MPELSVLNIFLFLALLIAFAAGAFILIVIRRKRDAKNNQSMLPDVTRQLVNIRLAGVEHKFYLEVGFAEELQQALNAPAPESGLFLYDTENGAGYAINWDCIEHVHIPTEFKPVEDQDAEGVSIFLIGENKPIRVGHVDTKDRISKPESQFLKFNNHYFNKDEVALLVRKPKCQDLRAPTQ